MIVVAGLRMAGTTIHGHFRLLAPSTTRPGMVYSVLVSQDGTRVSCECPACKASGRAKRGRLTVARADVLAGRVPHVCWHLRRAARLAPLVSKGFVAVREGRA